MIVIMVMARRSSSSRGGSSITDSDHKKDLPHELQNINTPYSQRDFQQEKFLMIIVDVFVVFIVVAVVVVPLSLSFAPPQDHMKQDDSGQDALLCGALTGRIGNNPVVSFLSQEQQPIATRMKPPGNQYHSGQQGGIKKSNRVFHDGRLMMTGGFCGIWCVGKMEIAMPCFLSIYVAYL